MLKIVNFNKEARKTRIYKRAFHSVEQGGLMKSLDEILKGLMKSKSLALADELLKNYNSQINSILKGFTEKLKTRITAIYQNLAHKTYYTRPALKISLTCSIFLDI